MFKGAGSQSFSQLQGGEGGGGHCHSGGGIANQEH